MPTIIIVVFMGAWVGNSTLGNWIVLLWPDRLFYETGGWPRPNSPWLCAWKNHGRVTRYFYANPWLGLTDPYIVLIIIAIRSSRCRTVRKQNRKTKTPKRPEKRELQRMSKPRFRLPRRRQDCPAASWPLAAMLLVIFSYCFTRRSLEIFIKTFPHSVAIVGFCLL